MGYRYFESCDAKGRVLYPFGFGLSYTTFEMTDLRLDGDTLDMDTDGTLHATVTVRNTGKVAGKEVVQLYINDPASTLPKPKKELKAFQKVFLQPGEAKDVTFCITKKMLESYDESLEQWVAEAGRYHILVGNSAANLPLQATFVAAGWSPYGYSPDAPLIQFVMNPTANAMLKQAIEDCGWDYSRLDDSIQFWPEQHIIESLISFYPYHQQKARWDKFFEDIRNVPVGEFSFKNVANWVLDNVFE